MRKSLDIGLSDGDCGEEGQELGGCCGIGNKGLRHFSVHNDE